MAHLLQNKILYVQEPVFWAGSVVNLFAYQYHTILIGLVCGMINPLCSFSFLEAIFFCGYSGLRGFLYKLQNPLFRSKKYFYWYHDETSA